MSRHFDAVQRQFVQNLGPQAGRDEAPETLLHVDPVEDVLQEDGLALHTLDLGDGVHDAGSGGSPLQLNEAANRHDDLFPNSPLRKFDASHHDHRLEPTEQLAWRVGVHRRHRSRMTGVHGLEHVERLRTTALSDDDPVGSHTQ